MVDRNNSKIKYACDIAIIKESLINKDIIRFIAVRDKKNNTPKYLWEMKEESRNYHKKLEIIKLKGNNSKIKDEYKKLKNNNRDKNKKSYQLYYEAINNVYNNYE